MGQQTALAKKVFYTSLPPFPRKRPGISVRSTYAGGFLNKALQFIMSDSF